MLLRTCCIYGVRSDRSDRAIRGYLICFPRKAFLCQRRCRNSLPISDPETSFLPPTQLLLSCSTRLHKASDTVSTKICNLNTESKIFATTTGDTMATSTFTQTQTLDSGNLFEVQSASQFRDLLSKDLNRVSLLNFWAPWAEPCKQMNEVVNAIAQRYPEILVIQVRCSL